MPSISVTNPEVITSIDLGTASPKLGGVVNVRNFNTLQTVNGDNQDLTAFQGVENISTLTSVDISDNKIVGDLQDFSNNTNCAIVDVSYNNYDGNMYAPLPTGIQSFTANNNNFERVAGWGYVYPTIFHSSFAHSGVTYTKTDEQTFTIVSSSTTANSYINFVTQSNGIRMGKHRIAFDLTLNSGSVSTIIGYYTDNDSDPSNGSSYGQYVVTEGSNVIDFEIFDDGVSNTPNLFWAISTGSTFDISVTNFEVTHEPVGIHDLSGHTQLAVYNTAGQSDSYGVDRNTDGSDVTTSSEYLLNWSGPGELTNTSVDAGSIEGAIPESIRILTVGKTNISKDSKRILLTQLYDTFKLKPTGWATSTASANGVIYSQPRIGVSNTRGVHGSPATSTGPWDNLLGKHSAVTINTAKAKLQDVGFTLYGY